ncbi:MAG: response regulator transcription factor [Bacteroidaceae bacterium]|nr:response regulator transcription factor [Bacteroidaceae bacterium]
MVNNNIALISRNTLMLLSFRQMLEEVMPFADFHIFSTTEQMNQQQGATHYYHYFVSVTEYLAHPDFYSQRTHQTIILIDNEAPQTSLPPVEGQEGGHQHSINMLSSREEILRQLLQMQQRGHRHFSNYPNEVTQQIRQAVERDKQVLTRREIEVLRLLAKGMINKEIADQLNISVNTAITHRKHIMQKLRSQSLSKLTIYAVQHGYVQPEEIK